MTRNDEILDEYRKAIEVRKKLEQLAERDQPKQPITIYDFFNATKKQRQESHVAQAGTIWQDRYLGRTPEEMQNVVNEMIKRSDQYQYKTKLVDDFLLSKNKAVTNNKNNKPQRLKAWGVLLPSWHRNSESTNE